MPARALCPRQTIDVGLPAFVDVNARVKNGFDWLPLGEATVRIGLRAMYPAVSGETFSPTENAGYSACPVLLPILVM
jgi:hypothetical protein